MSLLDWRIILKNKNKRKLVIGILVSFSLVLATLIVLVNEHQRKVRLNEAQTVLTEETDRVKTETSEIEENHNKVQTELKDAKTKKTEVENQLSEKKTSVDGLEQKKKELEEKLGGE